MPSTAPGERLASIKQHLTNDQKTMTSKDSTTSTNGKRLRVVIVGGSNAGLMCGIVLRRLGHDVHILEQYPSSTREGLAAGVGLQGNARKLLNRYDLLKDIPVSILSQKAQVLDANLKVKRVFVLQMEMSSWDSIYYRLRANFDAMKSDFCLEPPVLPIVGGQGIFDTGKRAMSVSYNGKHVLVGVEDLIDGGPMTLEADLVIAADGSSSRIREIVQPGLERDYPGYVGWRGTVPTRELPQDVLDTIELRSTFHMMHRNYIIMYTIPGANGSIEPGDRLINFVWYYHPTDLELAEIMTDTAGHRHRFTLPVGKMRPEIWAKQVAHGRQVLPAPVADLVSKIRQPFVSSITSVRSPRASYFDGKLLLVGDALCQMRPHFGASTDQAALHALKLEQLLKGEISLNQWEEQIMEYADLTRLKSTAFGSWFMNGYPTIVADLSRYLWMFVSQKLWRAWYGTAYPPPAAR